MTIPVYEEKLISIVKQQRWLMNALEAVRHLDLPDWYIAAGAIRNTVWNVLHGYNGNSHIKDVDVAYFDPSDLKLDREKRSEQELNIALPSLVFEVINQARAYQFDVGRPKATSSCDSISYWSETPTCVGVRLEKDNTLTICAPHGLTDLLELNVRPIPEPKRDMQLYADKIKEKQWDKTWSKLRIFNI